MSPSLFPSGQVWLSSSYRHYRQHTTHNTTMWVVGSKNNKQTLKTIIMRPGRILTWSVNLFKRESMWEGENGLPKTMARQCHQLHVNMHYVPWAVLPRNKYLSSLKKRKHNGPYKFWVERGEEQKDAQQFFWRNGEIVMPNISTF